MTKQPSPRLDALRKMREDQFEREEAERKAGPKKKPTAKKANPDGRIRAVLTKKSPNNAGL